MTAVAERLVAGAPATAEGLAVSNLVGETVRAAYPRRQDFAAFARSMDPAGKFSNDFLRRNVFGEAAVR